MKKFFFLWIAASGLSQAACNRNVDNIIPCGRENSSGTYVYFKEHILHDKDFAPIVQSYPGTAAVINAISKDPGAIGYGGIGYAKGVKVLKVKKDAKTPAVEPTMENVVGKTYPISRDLYLYTAGAPEGAAKHFIAWALGDEGQEVVKKVDYYSLPKERRMNITSDALPQGNHVLTIKGSDTMVILVQRWSETYMKAFPNVHVQVTGGGSGTGIAALIDGSTKICMASRPIKPAEKEKVKAKQNKDVVEFSVALDGLAIFVNESNPIQEISIPQLEAIFTAKVTKWSEVASIGN